MSASKKRAPNKEALAKHTNQAKDENEEAHQGEGWAGTGDEWFKHFSPELLSERLHKENLRTRDFFNKADVDHGNTITKKEFAVAVRALGFEKDYVTAADIDKVFDFFNTTKDGVLEYSELDKGLKKVLAAMASSAATEVKQEKSIKRENTRRLSARTDARLT